MPIVEALQAISASLGILKDFQAMRKEWDDATFKLKIAELTTTLAEAKMALVDARDDINQRDSEIERLNKAIVDKAETVVRYGDRFRTIGGEPVGRPLCPVCDLEGIQMEITRDAKCPRCKATFAARPQYYSYDRDASDT